MLEHYDTYKIEISDGTSIREIPNNADFFVPAGKDYTLTLSGTNTLNEAKSNSWELKDVLVANRYTLNCNPDLPSFTLPEQMEGDVWSTFIYITPMTAANMSSKPEMTEKVLANIVYEASADGINWIQAINDNGKTVIKGLVANNQYTIRSRFGSIICTNSQQVTMESAEQLENGNFESVWNKKEINGGNGSWSRPLYCYYLPGWNTRNERTTKGGESATGWGTGVGYGVWWRWCSGTVPTADSSKDANAVEISTLAFYNKKVSGTWSRDEVYTYTRDTHVTVLPRKKKLNSDIIFENVTFKRKSFALENINLTIKKGMKYAVVGHSGAGKSTLFKLIMGYEKNSSGVIRLDGEDIRNYDISELISYTDQNEHIYRAGIVDNITVFHSYPMDGIDSVGKNIWPEFFEGIFNRKEKECQRFSGGEKQAVAFLRMAAKNAEVILLDEPFSAMDAKMKSAVEHYLFTGKEFEGKTVLVITHDTREESLSQYDGIIHVGENGIYVE